MATTVSASSPLDAALRGALAGAGATAVMSLVMLASERAGLMGKHPPERILERGMAAMGEPPDPDAIAVAAGAAHLAVAAGAAHLAFGTGAGALFGVVMASRSLSVAQGLAMLWALAIWLVSYFGWIPALRILPPPPEDRPGRAWTMLVAHIVYGCALGSAWRMLRSR